MEPFDKLPKCVIDRLKEICPEIDFNLKKRAFNLLSSLTNEERLGMVIVLGYNEDNKLHVIPLFDDGKYQTVKGENIKDIEIIEKLKHHHYDGAMLVTKEGDIIEDSVMLCGNPNIVVREMGYDSSGSLNQSFGFKTLAGTRHISAITNSHHIPNAIYFILSEEKKCVRIFHKAKILYSPIAEEMMTITRNDSMKDIEDILKNIPVEIKKEEIKPIIETSN